MWGGLIGAGAGLLGGILSQQDEISDPYAAKREELYGQMKGVAEGKDLLAPKLMSGFMEDSAAGTQSALAASGGLSRNLAARNITAAKTSRDLVGGRMGAEAGATERLNAQNSLGNLLNDMSNSAMGVQKHNNQVSANNRKAMVMGAVNGGLQGYLGERQMDIQDKLLDKYLTSGAGNMFGGGGGFTPSFGMPDLTTSFGLR
jgi:hypothetical protein